ncbi:transporter substrate-binding domain-containing protein [Corynebacterium caspium]|uniref:transporter substrate-binding domain-containing protein n=1 Tax=Corynebacterium caspium TaxID=234828 RepID=UPI00036041BB|nr:transporter substrate-binding domain-containing protein [Corynebacterium caspium]WKD58662.1 ABC transporter glutamine-binding protein GlnH precursor [Corynebacterium caspium DSM 44850]
MRNRNPIKRRFSYLLGATFLSLSACTHPIFPGPQAESASTITPPSPHGLPLPAGSIHEVSSGTATKLPEHQAKGSLRPDNRSAAERVPRIHSIGKIVVGVDSALNLLSFRDPQTGELQGFEVDLAREIARDIFGDPQAVEFRFLDAAERAQAVIDHRVDIVIRAMSITSLNEEHVAFSTPYLATQTRVLTAGAEIPTAAEVNGHSICVADQSSALELVRQEAPNSPLLRTRNWSDCLVALQQGQVEAIVADDTLLSGIAAQDATTRFANGSLRTEYYGVAMNHADSDLVRQINSTIARISHDGTWYELYKKWFSPWLYASQPPTPFYREETSDEQ